MNGEQVDWSAWADDWQRVDAVPVEPSLSRRVQSRSRMLVLWVMGEVTVAAIAVTVLVYLAVVSTLAIDRLAMITLAVVCSAAAAFSLRNWRGTWRPADASQQAFLELSLLRCRRVRRAMTAGWWLLAAEVLCFAPWIAIRLGAMGASAGAYLRSYALLAVFVIAGILFLIALRRWADQEEAAIRELAATLDAT